jgi:hypothetical protein
VASDDRVTGTATGLAQDRLSRRQLQAMYKYTAAQLRVDPGLFDLFQRAFKEQWNKERFDSEVEQLPWYRNNAASVRSYLLLQAQGGADFAKKRDDTGEYVRQRAMKMGVNLSYERLNELTEDTMMFGWGSDGREYELDRAIVGSQSEGGNYGGDIEMNAENLRMLAKANNVKLDDIWFMSKAKSIAGGLSLAEDAQREIRRMAAEKSPGFATQIMAGENLEALTAPWRRMMEDEWELEMNSIPLDDPMLQSAIGGFTQEGAPVSMNLGEFQQRLRKDPRWLNSNQGQNKTVSAYSDVLKMFGMGG